jgi:hypothetical protein
MPVEKQAVQDFFSWSDWLDYLVLRPLSHIKPNWEVTWDHDERKYIPEEDSFAEALNEMIERIASVDPPARYHDNEDRLAEFVRDRLSWKIRKVGSIWVNEDGKRLAPDDYAAVMEQGAFDDPDILNLFLATSGRIHAAIARGQTHFDQMEESHQIMLAAAMSNILYHRDCGNW